MSEIYSLTPVELIEKLKQMTKDERYELLSEEIARNLSGQVRAMREHRGWSQAELAKQCGTHQSVIQRWETVYGMKHIRISNLCRLAAAFDVALVCRFVAWSEWVFWITGTSVVAEGINTRLFFPRKFTEELADRPVEDSLEE